MAQDEHLAWLLLLGQRNKLFWKYAPALKVQPLLKVSAFGDSLTAGSFNYPNRPNVWTPEACNDILARDTVRTLVTGSDIWDWAVTHSAISMSGAAYDGGVYTLTASAGQQDPRMAMGTAAYPSVSAGELYRLLADFDSTSSAGRLLAFRLMSVNAANTQLAETNPIGYSTSSGGYVSLAQTISIDRLIQLNATTAKLNAGGEIIAAGEDLVGLIRNLTLYKLSKGVAVVNQGTAGWLAGDGLTNIAQATGWSPTVCVVCFGTNDIRAAGDVPTNKAAFLTNLTDIVAALKAASVYPVLASMPPLASDQANYTQVPAWNAAIKALATSLQVGFWDRYGALNGDLTYIDDGRHPTAAGYLKLAQDLANQIRHG